MNISFCRAKTFRFADYNWLLSIPEFMVIPS
nr:MAG TPA: hypothetical protein [Caudoviricetes sp.]